jgi:hypothetical protein
LLLGFTAERTLKKIAAFTDASHRTPTFVREGANRKSVSVLQVGETCSP